MVAMEHSAANVRLHKGCIVYKLLHISDARPLCLRYWETRWNSGCLSKAASDTTGSTLIILALCISVYSIDVKTFFKTFYCHILNVFLLFNVLLLQKNVTKIVFNDLSLAMLLNTRTHTRLTALFPGLPSWSSTRKVKTNLDFTEGRDSELQWYQLGLLQVCTSLQTDNHASTPPLSFLQAGCPSCRPTNSVKALKGWYAMLLR